MIKIYGKNCINEAIRAKAKLEIVYLLDSNIKKDKSFIEMLKDKKIKYEILSKDKLDKKFGHSHQGYGAIREDYKIYDEAIIDSFTGTGRRILILDGLQDPHNLGAILRSADATGVDGIIIPKNRSVRLNDTVAKVSTGAIEHVDVCEVTNLNMTINDLKDKGFWVIGLELDGTIDYREQDYKGKIAVVVGSEGRGISKLVKENCDFLVRIPMYGKVNSLNASVSAGLLLYQILTSRGL